MPGSKSNACELGWLHLFLNNEDFAGIGDSGGLRGSVVPGVVEVSLHKGDPGEAGDQTTNEITTDDYPGYARVPVARTAGAWNITSPGGVATVKNVAEILFPQCTGGPGNVPISHLGIGTAHTGAGILGYYNSLTPNIVIAVGLQPRIPPDGEVITED